MPGPDLTGKLILSEFAGAATELRGAYMVNPHDTDGIKESILLCDERRTQGDARPNVTDASDDLSPQRL